jgi:hypothetical protein
MEVRRLLPPGGCRRVTDWPSPEAAPELLLLPPPPPPPPLLPLLALLLPALALALALLPDRGAGTSPAARKNLMRSGRLAAAILPATCSSSD